MPVIAAINGVVAGAGLSIAGAADIRIASTDAIFTSGFVDVGRTTDTGASYFLQRAMGYSRALRFLVSGEKVDAGEALELGLVDEVVDSAHVLDVALELAERIAVKPRAAVAHTKALLRAAESNTLAQQLEAEAVAYDVTAEDPERLAALAATRRSLGAEESGGSM